MSGLAGFTSRYRYMPFARRATGLAALITTLIALYSADQVTSVLDDLDLAQGHLDVARTKYEKAKNEARNLPRLEKDLAETESKLKEAKRRLPDEFIMDKVLQKAAMIAEDTGVILQVFDPEEGKISKTAYRYMLLPIKLGLFGTYSELASFFDRIAHLELMIHMQDIQLRRNQDEDRGSGAGARLTSADPLQLQGKKETKRIYASANMIIYRALSQEEASKAEAEDKKSTPGADSTKKSTPPKRSSAKEADAQSSMNDLN